MERYLSFSWNRFRFIDSLQFLNASLNKLVTATPESAMKHTATLPHHQLLLRKGVYPYEYVDSIRKFDETQLPDQVSFISLFSSFLPFHCSPCLYCSSVILLQHILNHSVIASVSNLPCVSMYFLMLHSSFLFCCHRRSFFSKLTGSGISDEDYKHAQTVWDTFQCQDLGKSSGVQFPFLQASQILMFAYNSDIYEVPCEHFCWRIYSLRF